MDMPLIAYATFVGGTGIATVSLSVWTIWNYTAQVRAERMAPALDSQYGERIKKNLRNLEHALSEDNNAKAASLIEERNVILAELRHKSSKYLDFADLSIGVAVRAGASLEKELQKRE